MTVLSELRALMRPNASVLPYQELLYRAFDVRFNCIVPVDSHRKYGKSRYSGPNQFIYAKANNADVACNFDIRLDPTGAEFVVALGQLEETFVQGVNLLNACQAEFTTDHMDTRFNWPPFMSDILPDPNNIFKEHLCRGLFLLGADKEIFGWATLTLTAHEEMGLIIRRRDLWSDVADKFKNEPSLDRGAQGAFIWDVS